MPSPCPPAGPPEGREVALVEEGVLDALTAGDAAFRAEIVRLYVDLTESHLRDLARVCREQDAPSIRSHAHSLEGSSATVGAARMVSLCARLSGAARAGDRLAVAPLFDDLRAAFQATARQLLKGGSTNEGSSLDASIAGRDERS